MWRLNKWSPRGGAALQHWFKLKSNTLYSRMTVGLMSSKLANLVVVILLTLYRWTCGTLTIYLVFSSSHLFENLCKPPISNQSAEGGVLTCLLIMSDRSIFCKSIQVTRVFWSHGNEERRCICLNFEFQSCNLRLTFIKSHWLLV